MSIEDITNYILEESPDSYVIEHDGSIFYYTNQKLFEDKKMFFATIVTKDNDFDNVSKLDRSGLFRLNIGVSQDIFDSEIKIPKPKPKIGAYLDTEIDFTAVNIFMPHPTYGSMNRICIINPSEERSKTIKEYLSKAYEAQLSQ